jgi:DNA-binding transcriptional regulator YiaG
VRNILRGITANEEPTIVVSPHSKVGIQAITVMNWERHFYTEPQSNLLPQIVEFLGYDPRTKRAPKGIGERLVEYRKEQGLSQRRMARWLGIDPSTLGRWQRDESQPNGKANKRVVEFLQSKIPKDLGREIPQINS